MTARDWMWLGGYLFAAVVWGLLMRGLYREMRDWKRLALAHSQESQGERERANASGAELVKFKEAHSGLVGVAIAWRRAALYWEARYRSVEEPGTTQPKPDGPPS